MSAANDKSDKRPGWLVEIVKTAVSTTIAMSGAVWTARGVIADFDKRLTVVEEGQLRVARELVPREEHKAHWEASEHGIADIKQDVRELRQELLGRRGLAQQP
jgi:hypothetical protein